MQAEDLSEMSQPVRKNDKDDDGPRCRVLPAENRNEERQYIIVEDDSMSSASEDVSVGSLCG
jgi:hypothetical protein